VAERPCGFESRPEHARLLEPIHTATPRVHCALRLRDPAQARRRRLSSPDLLDCFENRQTDALAHGRLVVQQIGEVHAVQDVVDLLLQHHPDRTDATVV
jgi:hypothetical protein